MPDKGSRPTWAACLGLFLLAWAVRTLFSNAGPDAHWPHSAQYKGDVFIWLRAVLAERTGQVFEVGLPMRPPGMIWLLDALWDGTTEGMALVKTIWRAMGAASVALLFLPIQRWFGRKVALVAGVLLAFGHGGLVLSGSVNNETPYLLLVALSLAVQPARVWNPGQGEPSRIPVWLLWGALHAGACLVRVEHLLLFLLLLAFALLAGGGLRGIGQRWKGPLLASLAFVLSLIPWHLRAWSMIEEFNGGEAPKQARAEAAISFVERQTPDLPWSAEARQALEAYPGHIRRSARAFIAATAHHRGRTEVGLADVGVIEEAFGTIPKAINGHPFVSSYGPLNFYLANNPSAVPGFSRAGLNREPPLQGGIDRYPSMLVQGLPPTTLAFEYPPHLEVFNDGYALGLDWITSSPGAWASLCLQKLGLFWRGASTGFGGDNLPLGPDGLRRAVDIATAEHGGATAWRWWIAALVVGGLTLGLRDGNTRAATLCWLLCAMSKVLIAAAFFGYARQGVLISPVVALALALVLCRWVAPWLGKHGKRLGIGLLLLILGLEASRHLAGVQVSLEGMPILQEDPIPVDQHRDREIRFQ